jgi:hypothetical protein
MSFWTDVRDTVEQVGTLGMYDPKHARHQEADQRRMINDQINAYKQQTALVKQQLDDTRNQEAAEKRRIEEKQIRSLRSSYRNSGIGVGMGQAGSQDTDSQLGG